MKPTHARQQGEIGQGWGLSGGGPVVSRGGQGRGLGGAAAWSVDYKPRRRGGQGLGQAGWRSGAAAQTP